MAAGILTLVAAFLVGGGAWLLVGPCFQLSRQVQINDLLNLAAYVGAALPVVFVVVFFLLELI